MSNAINEFVNFLVTTLFNFGAILLTSLIIAFIGCGFYAVGRFLFQIDTSEIEYDINKRFSKLEYFKRLLLIINFIFRFLAAVFCFGLCGITIIFSIVFFVYSVINILF